MGSSAGLSVMRTCHLYPFEGDLERMLKLEQYIKCLEDERKKIEAFKRELPLCMQLLNEEIEASKDLLSGHNQASQNQRGLLNSALQQETDIRSRSTQPLLDMFLPSKKLVADSSLQVNYSKENDKTKGTISNSVFSNDEEFCRRTQETSENVYTDMEGMKPVIGNGRAFLPFASLRKSILSSISAEHGVGEEYISSHVTRLSSVINNFDKESQIASTSSPAAGVSNSFPVRAAQRKPRRCWSPDLHRKFVDALQQLGGSEVATPKQIRELMNIDGLTNDEVKSHLQKYRLHTRRPNQNFHNMPSHTPQMVLIGGIWVPEYTEHAAGVSQRNSADQHNYHMSLTSLSKDHCVGRNNIDKGQVHPAITCSQGSSQEPPSQSSDGSKEEIMEDGTEAFSWKAGYQEDNSEIYDSASLHGS